MTRRAPRELGYRGVQVLAYVRSTIDRDGLAPSYGMICARLGFSRRENVLRVVARLESRGLLHRAGSGRVRRISLA